MDTMTRADRIRELADNIDRLAAAFTLGAVGARSVADRVDEFATQALILRLPAELYTRVLTGWERPHQLGAVAARVRRYADTQPQQ